MSPCSLCTRTLHPAAPTLVPALKGLRFLEVYRALSQGDLTMSLVPPDPTSPIFERTQPLTPLTTKGKPWRLRVWASPELVRDL